MVLGFARELRIESLDSLYFVNSFFFLLDGSLYTLINITQSELNCKIDTKPFVKRKSRNTEKSKT